MPKNQPELKLISLEDVAVEPVRWLWYPYIPLGKLTIIHGDPGEGKTTLALWIAAACSRGQALPGGETGDPLTVLYQTAEDGLGDTIKPRLLESKVDLQKIYTIDETDFPLSMLDHRIGEAIQDTHAQLMILDPMQAHLGEKVDMNRANEVRNVMKGLTKVASQTGCAIVLVGHLNKSQTSNSAQRGLGSMDFRAAARSVLLVGRLKNDRDIRVMVHDKSSLAPEGNSHAFSLDNGTLHWQEGYENLTADELLSGRSPDSKLTLAEQLILYHAFYVLAIYTGCRRGELCALRWSDFSFADHYTWNLVVSRSRSVVPGKCVVEGPTKNGRSRSMTISYYVVSTLWSLHDFQKRMARENHRKVSPYLFANAQGEPIHPDTFTKRLRKIFRELVFPSSFHLHTLRHYFVSTMLHEGVDKQTVAELAGHGDTSFLERTYCHPQMALKEQAAEKMEQILLHSA